MTWTELLTAYIDQTYKAADGLMGMVDDEALGWKPETGSNWMTTGQLLKHMTDACGFCCRGFVTGDWGFPEGVDPSQLSAEEMLPPAEKMPTLGSVAKARDLLAADKKLALAMVKESGEEDLQQKTAPAPWDPRPLPLGQRFMQMVSHLELHKTQLFYYLKLQGKPVNTNHLYGGM